MKEAKWIEKALELLDQRIQEAFDRRAEEIEACGPIPEIPLFGLICKEKPCLWTDMDIIHECSTVTIMHCRRCGSVYQKHLHGDTWWNDKHTH